MIEIIAGTFMLCVVVSCMLFGFGFLVWIASLIADRHNEKKQALEENRQVRPLDQFFLDRVENDFDWLKK